MACCNGSTVALRIDFAAALGIVQRVNVWQGRWSMLEFLILAAMAFAAYLGASGWWVLPAAAAMTAAGWWRKIRLLRQHPQVPLSTKMTTYLVVSIAINAGSRPWPCWQGGSPGICSRVERRQAPRSSNQHRNPMHRVGAVAPGFQLPAICGCDLLAVSVARAQIS